MSAEQLLRATLPLLAIKDLATASLPEYVATYSHQTNYLAPLRTRHLFMTRTMTRIWRSAFSRLAEVHGF